MARMGHDSERAALLGSRLGSPDTVPRTQDGGHGRAGRVRELQINRLFCKPICKPDAARQHGTGETEPME